MALHTQFLHIWVLLFTCYLLSISILCAEYLPT